MRKTIIAGLGILLSGIAFLPLKGQSALDAFRYSGTAIYSTARSMGAGGAFSAVGADFSAASLNPAGLAVYRRNDLMFTPSLRISNNEAGYLGGTFGDSRTNFGFSNIGFVSAAPVARWNRETRRREEAQTGLKSYAFAIGYNQIANFNRRTTFETYNPSSSMTDFFAGLATGETYASVFNQNNTTWPGLAVGAGVIDTSVVDGNWIGAAPGGQVQQRLDHEENGRINEWNLGIAGNFSDKIYAGATIGIRGLRYNSEFFFTEEDIDNVHQTLANDSTDLNSMTFSDIYGVRATGFNLNVGVIARPIDQLRIGVAIQTPTWYSMSDEYITEITSTFDNDPTIYGLSPLNGVFTYNLTTPFKVTVGAMGLIGKLGFISADFEYMDYSSAKFSSDVSPGSGFFYAFTDENRDIRTQFASAYNLRIGGEMRFGPGRFRLGYSNYGAVLEDAYLEYVDYQTGGTDKITGKRQIFSGGIGLKQKNYYIDLAYAREYSNDRRLLYTVQNPAEFSPELVNQITSNLFSMTIGFTF